MRGEYALNDVNALFFRCDVEDCFSRGVLCTANLDESLHAYYKAQALQYDFAPSLRLRVQPLRPEGAGYPRKGVPIRQTQPFAVTV